MTTHSDEEFIEGTHSGSNKVARRCASCDPIAHKNEERPKARMIATQALLLASALQLVASADVPITVQMFTSNDCSGTPTVKGTATDALTDAQTISGTSHPAGMCITTLGGGVSFMGSCPAADTTTTQHFNVGTSTVEQQGMRWCWMANGDCTGTCSSSAIFAKTKSWSVPVCKSHTDVFGGPSSYGIQSVKLSCVDAVRPVLRTLEH